MSSRNTRSRRAVGRALKDIERGLSEQDVKAIRRAKQRSRGPKRSRPEQTNTIGDYLGKNSDHVVIKGKLPYKTYDQMCWWTRRDKKFHFDIPDFLPPAVRGQFKGLLVERHMRKKVWHKKFKFVEGTLRALEKKYS